MHLYFLLGVLAGGDWPEFLGPTRDGFSAETGWLKEWPAGGPPRLFEKRIGEGYSGISVARGRLILCHRIGDEIRVESLDAVTGKEQWLFRYATTYEDDYGYNGGPRAAPLIHEEGGQALVYTLCSEGKLNAIALETGNRVWMRDLPGEHGLERCFFGAGAAPIADGRLIILNLGGTNRGGGSAGRGFTFALDRSTGETVWKTPTDGGAYATARTAEIDGARHLFIFHRGGLSCLDPSSGAERWRFPWRSRVHESVNAATPVVAGDIVLFTATYGTGGVALRVKKSSHEVLWKDDPASRTKALEAHWSTPSLEGGHLYGFSGRHEQGSDLRCVELSTGKVRWTWESYLGRGSLLRSDGHHIALGERGDLALLRLTPAGHVEVRRVPNVLQYPAWTPPALSNGLLYLRDEHVLICMDLRKR